MCPPQDRHALGTFGGAHTGAPLQICALAHQQPVGRIDRSATRQPRRGGAMCPPHDERLVKVVSLCGFQRTPRRGGPMCSPQNRSGLAMGLAKSVGADPCVRPRTDTLWGRSGAHTPVRPSKRRRIWCGSCPLQAVPPSPPPVRPDKGQRIWSGLCLGDGLRCKKDTVPWIVCFFRHNRRTRRRHRPSSSRHEYLDYTGISEKPFLCPKREALWYTPCSNGIAEEEETSAL